MPNPTRLPVSDIVFRDDLYPRISTSPSTVQQYADNLDVLPPIEVNQHNELIDGWHRWTAHKTAKVDKISVRVRETRSDAHFLELAIRSNAKHGLQLSGADKKKMAQRIYFSAPSPEAEAMLVEVLSASRSVVASWLTDGKENLRKERKETIYRMWLACATQEEIAAVVGMTKASVNAVCSEIPDLDKLNKLDKNNAEYVNDTWYPYNIWTKAKKTNAVSHPGNTETEWLDRLVWGYTKPFDVVCDPFGGGGSTIDVCKRRMRRYMVSDIEPIPARESEIRKHDVTEGALKPPKWGDVKLVYLDPPYWIQQEYGNGETDLSSMSLDAFHDALAATIKAYSSKVSAGCKIALIIQPTQWKAPDRKFTDHTAAMLKRIKMPIVQRIQAPYQSEQCLPQMVNWAKENREWLVLSREITIWEAQ